MYILAKRYILKIDRIVCHRRLSSSKPNSYGIRSTQYLIIWQQVKSDPATTPLSWHPVEELAPILDLLQRYVSDTKAANRQRQEVKTSATIAGRKRKYFHDDPQSHLPTPQSRSATSREQSIVSSSDSDSRQSLAIPATPEIYNGVFQRRQGIVVAVPRSGPGIEAIDATLMPMKHMVEDAFAVDMIDAELAIRHRYQSILERLPKPPVTLVNDLDHETPSLGFKFISEYVLGEGVERMDQDTIVGCDQCKPNMGANRGCEYTQKCACLEYAEPDESAMNEAQLALWDKAKYSQEPSELMKLPKKFPYFSTGPRAGCLVDHYLKHRYMIYECNENCSCGPNCKNRNVQHGRKVKLEIFKTPNRGFGLRCPQPLRKGQFIDTYLGEILTDQETIRREDNNNDPSKASYLFSLDKFAYHSDGSIDIKAEDMYTVDGQFMGCPTRFINHCCDPNLRMYTVSYAKYDRRIYDLAFFAVEAIEAGTELTFDYMDVEETDEKTRNVDASRVPCHCGAENCRGSLWS